MANYGGGKAWGPNQRPQGYQNRDAYMDSYRQYWQTPNQPRPQQQGGSGTPQIAYSPPATTQPQQTEQTQTSQLAPVPTAQPFNMQQKQDNWSGGAMGSGGQGATGIDFNNPMGGFGSSPGPEWGRKKNLGFGGMFV